MSQELDYYLSLPYPIQLIPDDEGNWVAQIPLLRGCRVQSNLRGDALDRLDVAKRRWIETALARNEYIPEPDPAALDLDSHLKDPAPSRETQEMLLNKLEDLINDPQESNGVLELILYLKAHPAIQPAIANEINQLLRRKHAQPPLGSAAAEKRRE